MRSVAGMLPSRNQRAISIGTSAADGASEIVAAARVASALNVAIRAAASPWPRAGTIPIGACARRAATAARRGASSPETCSERRTEARISSRAVIGLPSPPLRGGALEGFAGRTLRPVEAVLAPPLTPPRENGVGNAKRRSLHRPALGAPLRLERRSLRRG